MEDGQHEEAVFSRQWVQPAPEFQTLLSESSSHEKVTVMGNGSRGLCWNCG